MAGQLTIDIIEEHNKKKSTWFMAHNHLSDMVI